MAVLSKYDVPLCSSMMFLPISMVDGRVNKIWISRETGSFSNSGTSLWYKDRLKENKPSSVNLSEPLQGVFNSEHLIDPSDKVTTGLCTNFKYFGLYNVL